MKTKLEIELKEVLEKEILLVEEIYRLYLKIKETIENKNEVELKEIATKTKISLESFKEIESKRDEIWKKFTKNENFGSTYEAVEKLTTIYKKEIYEYLHKLKIGILNIKNLNYIIQNYVNTSLDMLAIIFQDIQESVENVTYKNPYGPKLGRLNEASILINKKL
ncbi:flagellar protein FlbF [Borrelia sp. CA_690]|uniref:Flagellar protein FlbF n=1 Tax=Borrelia maritima TaxID=2761123 RepID=A0A5J6WAP3_9SPIR|nr:MULTISPECIES: flagellar protein FlbF [Borrelia]QFI14323.1 flagellar protein FlbF [Borrelia maritima]WKC84178.1 flagellar protein FlbF [Borrelia sp. CA_690]